MTFELWLAYITTVLILMSTPGPSQLLMLSNSASYGFNRAWATMAGDLSANALQMTVASLGLAGLTHRSHDLFLWIKWSGVAYLFFMGVMLFVLGALAMVVFQQIGQTAPALTALDYAEIEQLYTRYAFAVDTGADDGGMWAETFTEDGVFGEPDPSRPEYPLQGYEELKAFANTNPALTPRHYTTNILIEPTPEGAMGSAYVIIVTDAEEEDGQRPAIRAKAVYHDQLVKTAEGWRFKKRTGAWGAFPDDLLQALDQ